MKHYKKIFSIIALVSIFGLSSCLKDVPNNSDPSRSNNVVEFQNSSVPMSYTSIYPQYANSFPITDTAWFPVVVNYAGPQFTAPQDIVVTIAIDTAALDAFNDDQESEYVVPPADIFTLPTTVTIPKGSSQATIKVSVHNTADFDFGEDYALPLTITSASYGVISSNYGTAIYSFGFQNQYDGHYTVTGTMIDYSSSSLTGKYPMDVYLITAGSSSVYMYDKAIGGTGHSILSGSSTSYYGSFDPVFNFDGNNNVTSVVNLYGQPSGNGRSAELDPSGINTYDPSTKTINVSYWMNQPSVIAPHRTSFVETYTYVGARD